MSFAVLIFASQAAAAAIAPVEVVRAGAAFAPISGALSPAFPALSLSVLPSARMPAVPAIPAAPLAAAAPIDRASERFLQLHRDVREDLAGPLPAAAKSYRYYFVPGFTANHISGYMAENVERLKALGLDADRLAIATEGDRNGSLAAIGRAVAASPKPVILIGHSLGGMHIHDWYRLAPDGLKARTAGLILMQAPIGGSPVADAWMEHWFTRAFARFMSLLPTWGNGLETMREMSVPARRQVLAGLPRLTLRDMGKILILQGSFDPAVNGRYHRDMKPLWKVFEGRRHELSDGVVGVAESVIPGARTVRVDDLDHEDTVIQDTGWIKWLMGSRPNPKYRPGDITEALVRFFFRGRSRL